MEIDDFYDQDSSQDELDILDPDVSSGDDSDQDGQAEEEIDNDFSRLVGNIHEANDATPGRSWDFSIEEDQETAWRDELRAASGIGQGKGKARARAGRHTGDIVLSPQIKTLIGQGTQAYVDQQLDIAISKMQEVIRIEPRAPSAWSILIACHRDLGQSDKVLQLGIMAAHLNGDYETWFRLAEESKGRGFVNQALYCYRKASLLDPTGVEADWERSALAKEAGDIRTVKSAYLSILRRFPHDTTVLTELRPILIESNDLSLCQELYNAAFNHYRAMYPSGSDETTKNPGGGFTDFHIYVLADLDIMLGDYDAAILVIKRGMRWLQGRGEQTIWDSAEGDREFDVKGVAIRSSEAGAVEETSAPGNYELDVNARHRLAIARLKLGDIEEAKLHCKVILACDILEYAPLFQEIADAYYERDLYEEALPLYEDLASEQSTSSLHVLLQTAACRRYMNDLKGASEVYEHSNVFEKDMESIALIVGLAISNWPDNADAKMKLAEVYEIMGEPRKALQLVYQVIDARKRKNKGVTSTVALSEATAPTSTDQPSTSLFDENRTQSKSASKPKTGRLSQAEIKAAQSERQARIDASYKVCKSLWERMKSGDDSEAEAEWLIEAEKLVEHFREMRELFPTSKVSAFRGLKPSKVAGRGKAKSQKEVEKEVDDVATRLQLEIESENPKKERLLVSVDNGKLTIFHGISIDEWFMLILEYSFLLTRKNLYGISNEVLKHVRLSIVFQEQQYQDTLRLALVACAMQIPDYDTITEQCRMLINTHQFNNEPLRILAVALGSGLKAAEAFVDSKLQKHLLRELKITDSIVTGGREVKWNGPGGRWTLKGEKEGEEDEVVEPVKDKGKGKKSSGPGGTGQVVKKPRVPTKPNPLQMTMYGLLCGCAKSYQSALFYLLQSYHVHPDDPITCLGLGIACIGRAMQRQADNRNYMIVQGFAFLSRYRTLKGGDETTIDEVDYNFGRAFQQLGLYTNAVKHYQKVLKNAEGRVEAGSEDVGLAREAAYNLSIIFVTTGATKLADALYRKWLSL